MSADVLRQAAAQIRNDHGGIVSRCTQEGRRWLPVADLLDHAAARAESKIEHGGKPDPVWSHERDALAVARAYLEDQP